jgi:release factor glutamine methyltransferase
MNRAGAWTGISTHLDLNGRERATSDVIAGPDRE